MNTICEFWRGVNTRVFLAGITALGATGLGSVTAFAQETTTNSISLDESISSIDLAEGLSSVGEIVAGGICLAIGFAASIWAIGLAWRKIRSFGR